MLEVLHPLEVRDDHAAGVGHHVGDDVDVLVTEDLVGGRRSRAVGALEDHLALHPVSVLLVDHAAERRGDEDVARDRDQVRGRDLLAALEFGEPATLADVGVEPVGIDAALVADRAGRVGDSHHRRPELLHDASRPGPDVAVSLDDEGGVRGAEAQMWRRLTEHVDAAATGRGLAAV